MAIQKVHIEEFLELSASHPVLDVRSPGEYDHAHIPGAHSLPLFSNEERKIVGTAYKQESREKAIKLGLDFFGKKMTAMVEQTEEILNRGSQIADSDQSKIQNSKSKIILVHCWRGGMRSAGVAWLLDLYGFKVYTLIGGYKSFRHWAIQQFEKNYSFNILGGFTGSGKTETLAELEKKGEIIIDLEAIAVHKGSAFGGIGLPRQPTQEMFENILAQQLQTKNQKPQTNIWLEDESQRIGLVNIPQPFWNIMRRSPVMFMDIPFEERLEHVVGEYGKLDKEKMMGSIERIQKRLGGLETKTALAFLEENDVKECFRIILKYYDKHYLKGLHNRESLDSLLQKIPCKNVDLAENAKKLLSLRKKASV